mmetsp:Transcript_11224/g.22394  ORF Transcript_11224/g.22394 Transcript_11224/m.22394 type:complete len:726 (+) Transcript_11224:42-2219(+)
MLNCSTIRPLLVILAAVASSSAFVSRSSPQSAARIQFATTTTTQLASTTAPPASTSLGVSVGDTKGAVLYLNDINISTGSGIQILKSINFRVDAKERWGIVGPNGCGKSTLLGAITGTVRIDDGEALVASKVKVGYLKQTAVSGSTKTVKDEAASEMEEINSAKRWMNQLEQKIAEGDSSDKTLNDLATAQERFASAGGWTQDQDVDVVLKGLGFLPTDSDRLCSDFSGGWKMRIGLAKLLLSKPDLLLLDEPSNHLDSSARDWLATYLSNYDGSILLVSHDISLLTKSVNSIAEINGETLIQYVSCNYDKYLVDKEFRAKSALAEYERNVKEAARLQEFVDKYGASATKASAAQSRVKMIEKMRKEGKLDPPPLSVTAKRMKPSLQLPDPPKGIGEKLLSLVGADIGYDGEPLAKGIDLTINRGMKLILRGPNGAGKSTLLSSLRGKLPLIQGKRVENENLRLGVFTQDLAQELDVNSRAMDLVTEYAREGKHGDITISNQDARGVMGRLGLSDEKPLRKIGELSGGEKARVALSMFALKASNLLLLDEPSNHLDQECIEALGDSLSNWGGNDGSVVVVSHDRAFCEQVGFTHVGTVKDGKLTIEERGLQERDWERYDISSTPLTGASESGEAVIELTPEEKAEQDRKRKLAFNAPKRIQKITELIEKSEAKIVEYDDEMMTVGNDVEKLMALTDKKTKEEETVVSLMEEWEELEDVIAEMASL